MKINVWMKFSDNNELQVFGRNFTFSDLQIDFETSSVQLKLTMLPPIQAENLTRIDVLPFGKSYGIVQVRCK